MRGEKKKGREKITKDKEKITQEKNFNKLNIREDKRRRGEKREENKDKEKITQEKKTS